MIKVRGEEAVEAREALDIALKTHADKLYQQDNPPKNFTYAKSSGSFQRHREARLRTLALQQLIEKGTTSEDESEVTGVTIARIRDLRDIVEIIFGEKIPEGQEGVRPEYTSTVFEGIYCRTEIQASNALHGSLVSLDFATENSL